MRKIIFTLFISTISLLFVGYIINTNSNTTSFIDLTKLPKDYTREMAKKNGDVVGKSTIWKLDKFIQNAKVGKKDLVRMTNFTDEGAPIIQDLSCNKHIIMLTIDGTRDDSVSPKFKLIRQYRVLSIIKEKYPNGFVYVAKTKNASWGLMAISNK